MMGYDWGMSWGVGMLFMVLFWVFVIAGAVWLVTTLSRQRESGGSSGGSDRSALRILEERLARGEIDVEEFRARRAAMEEGRR